MDHFEHKSVATTIGHMLCTHRQMKIKNVELGVDDMNIYNAHKKTRKIFTTFVCDVFRKCGETRVLTANYDRLKTSDGQSYSYLVVEEVTKAIWNELFNGRNYLFFYSFDWGSDEDHNMKMAHPNKRSKPSPRKIVDSSDNEPTTIVWKPNTTRIQLTYKGNYCLLLLLFLIYYYPLCFLLTFVVVLLMRTVLEDEIRRVVSDRRNYDRRCKASKRSATSEQNEEEEEEEEGEEEEEEEDEEEEGEDVW